MNPRNEHDLAYRLISRAAHQAPPALRERLEEEWLADLASRTGASRLRLAANCFWATAIITREFRVPQLATAGGKPLLGTLPPGLPLLSRRTISFIAIAGLHGLLIWGLMNGLAQRFATTLQQPQIIDFHIDTTVPQHEPTAVDSTVKLHIFTEHPIPIDPERLDLTPGAGAVPGPAPIPFDAGPAHPPVQAVVHRVTGGPAAGFPHTEDFYPAASRRLGESGAATVQVCVDTLGRLTGAPQLLRSSGKSRLDAGAINLAAAGSGHYRPTAENGQPVNGCYSFAVRFALND